MYDSDSVPCPTAMGGDRSVSVSSGAVGTEEGSMAVAGWVDSREGSAGGGGVAPAVGRGGGVATAVGRGGGVATAVGRGGGMATAVGRGGGVPTAVGRGGGMATVVGRGGECPVGGAGGGDAEGVVVTRGDAGEKGTEAEVLVFSGAMAVLVTTGVRGISHFLGGGTTSIKFSCTAGKMKRVLHAHVQLTCKNTLRCRDGYAFQTRCAWRYVNKARMA